MPVPDLLASLFPDLHYIWVTRRDKVRQAISLWKAIQTWKWKKDGPSIDASQHSQELAFHFDAIDHLVRQLVEYDEAWQHYFAANGLQPFTVVYEELTGAYEETARNILRYLNIPISGELVFAERSMKRQANALSEEWVQQYYALKREQECWKM